MSAANKPERRKLTFAALDEAVADAENLLAKGYDKVGNWDLAQVCFHLAEWLRYPVEGFPRTPPLLRPVLWLMRNTVAGPALRAALEKGAMPAGQPTLTQSVTAPGGDPSEAVAKLKEAVERFKAFPGPYKPSPLLGVLDHETGHKVQRLHCAHHLSFLIPQA
ncbi:DUF1569 domain-containing protein [Gemmata sp. JC717]|uniref:DUF1569 domain-containing protein n=1 Tax=Gemmata algarum TaxID=2975278 RepID=UPI0021BA7A4A|nr:DUF1569 domain-containing protein [Gemmata algarum]MDY3556378.1 DUF1569 domain-containing protein [Gemmata algarum]